MFYMCVCVYIYIYICLFYVLDYEWTVRMLPFIGYYK